jgi:hypothetical protein
MAAAQSINAGFNSQPQLASFADIERSHMGEVERGAHIPNLAIVFTIVDGMWVMGGEETLGAVATNQVPITWKNSYLVIL